MINIPSSNSFEFDFADRRGAFSVVSVALLVYDLSEKLIWHETRQMPALGDENTQGYDNTFIWPLKNIDTGAAAPDASYTFRLVTTMKSGKQYVSYFSKDVARTAPPPPATGPLPPEAGAGSGAGAGILMTYTNVATVEVPVEVHATALSVTLALRWMGEPEENSVLALQYGSSPFDV